MGEFSPGKHFLSKNAKIAGKWVMRILAFLGASSLSGLLVLWAGLSKFFSENAELVQSMMLFVSLNCVLCISVILIMVLYFLGVAHKETRDFKLLRWTIWGEYHGYFDHKDYSIDEDNKIRYLTQSINGFNIDHPELRGCYCSAPECDVHRLVSLPVRTSESVLTCPLCKTVYATRPWRDVLKEAQEMFSKEVMRHIINHVVSQSKRGSDAKKTPQ